MRPKPLSLTYAAEKNELHAYAKAAENGVQDDVLQPAKGLAPEVFRDFDESADPAIEAIGTDAASRAGAMCRTAANEDAPSTVDHPIGASKDDCTSVDGDVVADTTEKSFLLEAEESTRAINPETSAGDMVTNEELPAVTSIRKANPNSTDTVISDRRSVSGSPIINKHAAYTTQTIEDHEETANTLTSTPNEATNCSKAITSEMAVHHPLKRDKSDITNPIVIERTNTGFNVVETEDNITPSRKVAEETSPTVSVASPDALPNQSVSELGILEMEAEELNLLPADSEATNLADLFWSPKVPIVPVNKDAATSFLGTDQGDAHSKQNSCKSSKSARSGPGDIVLQSSPIAQKIRHSIRLSMEDLTPEEITEAVIVFHDYTDRRKLEPTSEAPSNEFQSRNATGDTCHTPPREVPAIAIAAGEISEELLEVPIGRTRSGARFSDDTNMLKEFLSRAQARKLAQPSSIPMSAPKPLVSPRTTPRKALAELDSNSPSTQKQRDIASRPGTPPGKGKLSAVDFDDAEEVVAEPTSCRRSTRTRSPAPSKTVPGAPSFIPVRRADGTDPVVLQKSAAQELAIVTRANTRRNKGQAKVPSLTLQNLPTAGSDVAAVTHGYKDAKSVGWDETLLYFYHPKGPAEAQEEIRPRVRRLRGFGGVNGTPAAKKMMMTDVSISYGTPAPKRQGRMRW